jgi:hypothetical protein
MRSAWLTAAAQLAALCDAALVDSGFGMEMDTAATGSSSHRGRGCDRADLGAGLPAAPQASAPRPPSSVRSPPRHPPPACFVQREQAALNSRFGQVEQPGQFGVGDPASAGGAGVRAPGVIPNGSYEPRRRCPGRRNIRVAGRRGSPGEVVHDELVAVGASKEVEVGGCSAAA